MCDMTFNACCIPEHPDRSIKALPELKSDEGRNHKCHSMLKKKNLFPEKKNISSMKCKFSPALCMILTSNTLLCTGWWGTSLCVLPLRWFCLHLPRVIVQLKLHRYALKAIFCSDVYVSKQTNLNTDKVGWTPFIFLSFELPFEHINPVTTYSHSVLKRQLLMT